jgi:hypothetical protein
VRSPYLGYGILTPTTPDLGSSQNRSVHRRFSA